MQERGLGRTARLQPWQRSNLAATLTHFLLTSGFSFSVPFLPLYLRHLDGMTLERAAFWSGVAQGAGGIGSFFTGPLWGAMGDRFGRKPMLVRAAVGSSLGLLAFGFASTTWQVVIARLWIGVMGGSGAAAMALVASGTPPDRMARSLGILQGGSMFGVAIGPAFGVACLNLLGFRGTFVATSGLMFLGALTALVLIREDRSSVPGRPTGARPVRAGALAVLRSPAVLRTLLVVGIVGLARPLTQPVLPGFVETLATAHQSVSFAVGLLFFGMSAVSAVAAINSSRLTRRFGTTAVLVVSCVGSTVLLAPQGAAQTVAQLMGLVWAMSVFQGVLQASTVALLSSSVPQSMVSSAFGVYQSVTAASTQLGPMLGGTLVVALGFRPVFVVGAAMFLLAAIVASKMPDRARTA